MIKNSTRGVPYARTQTSIDKWLTAIFLSVAMIDPASAQLPALADEAVPAPEVQDASLDPEAAMKTESADVDLGEEPDSPPDQVSTDKIEEIVVTARKRNEKLIDTPVAVQFIDSGEIRDSAITGLAALGAEVPQLHIAKYAGGGSASIAIRGIGSPAVDAGVSSTVSLVFDGVQLSRGALTSIGLFDTGNIQVLKGPQALFFGKNSPGGVISVNSNRPTDTWRGYAQTSYEINATQPSIEVAIGGPLSDTLKVRFAAKYDYMEGYLHNDAQPLTIANVFKQNPNLPQSLRDSMPSTVALTGAPKGRYPTDENLIGRSVIEWTPTEELSANIHMLGARSRNDGQSQGFVSKCASGSTPYQFGIPDPTGRCDVGTHFSAHELSSVYAAGHPHLSDLDPFSHFEGTLNSLEVNYDTGDLAFTAVTGLAYYDQEKYDNFDGQFGVFAGAPAETYHQFSQEIRVRTQFDTPLNFVSGVLFEKSKQDIRFGSFLAGGFFPADPVTGRFDGSEYQTKTEGNTVSPFLQAIWMIRDNLELDIGARWTRELRSNRQFNTYVSPYTQFLGIRLVPVGTTLSGEQTAHNLSPEATLTWHPMSDAMVYAAIKTGFKSGGFSNPALLNGTAATTNDAYAFKPEKVLGGEVGAKGRLFDGSVQVTGAIYNYRFEDLQQSIFNAETISYSIKNAAVATTQGIESDVTWKISPELALRAALSYNRGRFSSYDTAPCYSAQPNCPASGQQDLSDSRLPYSSDWIEQFGFDWDRQLVGDYRLKLASSMQYRSKFNTSTTDNPTADFGPIWLLDANLALYPVSEKWRLGLSGRNLLNEMFIEIANDRVAATNSVGGRVADIYGPTNRPREIWMQLTVNFGE